MKKFGIAFALLFANIVIADTLSLSLNDAITMAFRNNSLVSIERINTDIAKTILKEQYYAYEPQIEASYSTESANQVDIFSVNQAYINIRQTSPTGTTFEARSQGAQSHYNSVNTIRLSLTQALLQGANPAANLTPIRKARIDIDITNEELSAYAQKLFADVERAYWNVILSAEELKIYKYSLDLAQRFLYESQERLKMGSVATIDLAAITAEAASREKQLFDAESAYKQNILYFIYLINAPQFNTELALSDTAMTLGKEDAVDEHIEAAKQFRQDYRQAQMLAKKGQLDLIQTKNGLLPRLNFFINLQGSALANDFGAALLPHSPIPDTRITEMGLIMQFPLTNGAARQKYIRAGYSLEQMNLAVENFLRLLEYEIRAAHIEALRAFRQIETAKTVSALQQQKLNAEQERMNVGKSTGYAVLQVQRDLVSANLDEARARIAYIDALLSLYSKDATLLQRRGVAVNSIGE